MASTNTLTPEQVAKVPQPGYIQPVNITFSPDDALITFLFSADHSRTLQLYAFDPQTGERGLFLEPPSEGGAPGGVTDENVSLEEALRRERARQWGTGVTDYAWAKEQSRLLIPLSDGVYVQDAAGLRKVIESGAQDARLSPDGARVAFVRDDDLWVLDLDADGEPRPLTTGAATAGVTRGLAEFVAAEEMSRHEGYWWSPDGTRIAFTEVDERRIPVYRFMHQGKDALGEGAQEDHRYPFTGQENAIVRLAVADVATGEITWMNLSVGGPGSTYEYLARVKWVPGGEQTLATEDSEASEALSPLSPLRQKAFDLVAVVQDRRQKQLDLLRFDPSTGQAAPLLHEAVRDWINLHDIFHALPQNHAHAPGGFIWASERTGFRHLFLHDQNGRPMRQLTTGEWAVETLAGVDEAGGWIYFIAGNTAAPDGATERHLYRVALSGGQPQRITQQEGWHTVVVDHARRRFVDTHESLNHPPRVTLREIDGDRELAVLHAADADPRVAELGLQPPERVTLESRDGATLLGLLYRPDARRFGPGPYPTVIDVYGGPHVQRATQWWRGTANMRAQYLRSLGFLVFTLDNRGSAGRGMAFEAALKGDMGRVEVEDQVDGVRWLVAQGLADRNRVGVYGWSYGGYMALMCLARAPETFAAAVAGAPVTHWDGYDTHYTERYMGLPAENAAGYRNSSPLTHAANISGKLLLVHGLIDENVHFRHTARLINALIRGRKPYELMLFPDERHMPRRVEDRVYMEERIRDFFLAALR
jgi:dipeptidyl-peptidase-4